MVLTRDYFLLCELFDLGPKLFDHRLCLLGDLFEIALDAYSIPAVLHFLSSDRSLETFSPRSLTLLGAS